MENTRSPGQYDHSKCELHCLMCDRPHDNFMHVHFHTHDGSDKALCMRCLTALAGLSRPLRHAYEHGGYVFDRWGYEHDQSRDAPTLDVPPGIARDLEEMFERFRRDESDNS